MCDHHWNDAGRLYDYETRQFTPVLQCEKCKGVRVAFVRMRPKEVDSFVNVRRVVEEESAIRNLLTRKDGDKRCRIDHKRSVERMSYERICGCAVTTLMDGSLTHVKFCDKHELEVSRLKREKGNGAYEDRVLSIVLDN